MILLDKIFEKKYLQKVYEFLQIVGMDNFNTKL